MPTQTCGCDTTATPRYYCEEHSFDSPESSNVKRATYDVLKGDMEVTFQSSKNETRIYRYAGVGSHIFARFRVADSKGEFFQNIIRPSWTGVRL